MRGISEEQGPCCGGEYTMGRSAIIISDGLTDGATRHDDLWEKFELEKQKKRRLEAQDSGGKRLRQKDPERTAFYENILAVRNHR